MPIIFPSPFERFSDKVRENKSVMFPCHSTMSDSNNNEKTRNVRLGRQMSSIPQIENSGDTENLYVTADGRVKTRKRNIRKVTSFENLADAVNESNNNDGKATSLSPTWIGSISVVGRRRDMEDALTVSPVIFPGDHEFYDFFAVYDGHGGSAVANACRDRLHKLLEEELEGSTCGCGSGGLDWEKLMSACFAKMDEEITGSGAYLKLANSLSVTTLGSTAVVVVVGKDVLVVANCGDSRAILCRGGVAIPLSRDHKPNNPDERERVEAAGGCVVNWDGYRVSGVLATSRSIGDVHLKPCVISEPEVTVCARTASDDFIIIATDGLWDVVSNDSACVIVRRCLAGKLKTRFLVGSSGSAAAVAAATLAEMAMARGSRDNISAIVVQLKTKA